MNAPRFFTHHRQSLTTLLALMALLQLASFAHADTNLIPAGSTWRYLANGTGPVASWTAVGFDDSGWSNGVAKLGFGGDGEVTTIGFTTNGYTTFYFRRAFSVTGAASITNLFTRLVRDDGAVVYLNGVEAFRNNMPTGAVNRLTLAPATLSSPDETNFVTNAISPALLQEGANVMAVEIHQSATNSSDLGFELVLIANSNLALPTSAVAITNVPASSNLFAGSNVIVAASAASAAGVARVDFYANGQLQGSDASAPYSFTLLNAAPGPYTLVAVAVDYGGLSITSAPVQITVALEPGVITLVSRRSCWRYWDFGSLPDPDWLNFGYEDGRWLNGCGELGYGDGDEDTLVSFGADANNRFVTTYFRHTFSVGESVSYTNLILRIKRDDGAVAYLNGTEVFRNNMPAGAVSYGTFASGDAADDGATYFSTNVSASLIAPGQNVLAVEVHQSRTNSSDVSFDAELIGQAGAIMPQMSVSYLGNAVQLTWPQSATAAFQLQRSPLIGPASSWQAVAITPVLTNGVYHVVDSLGVGNGFYRMTATSAPLEACQPPLIVSLPAVTRVPIGTNVTLQIAAMGPGPLTYAWRKNESGALSPGNSLSFTNVQRRDGGAYDVVMGNTCSCQLSCPMLLVVGGTEVELADNFAARTKFTNSVLQLNISNVMATAEVNEPVVPPGMFNRSQWLEWKPTASGIAEFDTAGSAQGTALAIYTGSALNALTVTAISGNDFPAASSHVVFNAVAGTAYNIQLIGSGGPTPFLCLNGRLTTTTNAAPQIIQQPQSQYVEFGSNAMLTVQAVLPPAITNGVITYQWFKAQALLANATNSTLAFASMSESNISQYFAVASFNSLSVTSALASLAGMTRSLIVGQGSISQSVLDFGTTSPCAGPAFARYRLYYFRVPLTTHTCQSLSSWCSPSAPVTDSVFQPTTVTSTACIPLDITSSTKVTFSTLNNVTGLDAGLYIYRHRDCNYAYIPGSSFNNTSSTLESGVVTFGGANNANGLLKVFLMYNLPVNSATSIKLDYTYAP